MSDADRLTTAAALAVLLASAALVPVYDGLGWLPAVAGAVLAVAVASALARRAQVPALLQPLVGLAALAAYTLACYARATLDYGLLPTAETTERLRTLIGEGLLDVEALAPPVPTSTGLVLLAVLGVGALAVVVDLVAVALDRPAAAGLPLLLLFAVPSATVTGGVGWWPFLLGAAGWLGLLLVEGGDRVSRWGVPLRSTRPGTTYDDPGLSRVGRRIGAAALGVAVVVPALLPGLDGRLLGGGGEGIGFGGGSRSTTTYNPITELGGQLTLPVPRPLLTYTTDDPAPDYLRLTTLDLYDGAQWSSSELSGSVKDEKVEDGLPEPVGLDLTRTRQVTTEITIDELGGPWLPVTFPTREVGLEGPWVWDPEPDTAFSTRRTVEDVDDSYRVLSARVEPAPGQLGSTGGLPPEYDLYATPPEVTDYVRQLTSDVVAGQLGPYQQVAALQAFFTDRTNGFFYSEDASVPGTNAPDALENFLRGRQGFCEQYASAMAAMVRLLGIPARVAVGFTPGESLGGGRYQVTTEDAHAWPEVWFPGTGWLRFEPTPRSEQVTTPDYTRPAETPLGGEGDQAAVPTPTPVPSTGPGGEPLRPDGNTPLEGEGLPGAGDSDPGAGSSPLAVVALVLLAALTLLLVPLALTTLRQHRRPQQG
jgi:transglutaminase-like putative cysteine protease